MSKQLTFIKDPDEILGVRRKASRRTKKEEPTTFDCDTCGLNKKCKKPKIKRFGKNCKDILFIGLCPGRDEDRYGIPFIGDSGTLLKEICSIADINLDRDCSRTNIVRCYPGKDERSRDIKPTSTQILCCASNLQTEIEEIKPKLIVCLGTEAIQSVLKTSAISAKNATSLHGKVFPYHGLNCWVGCMLHPSFFLHRSNNENGMDDKLIMAYDLANIISVLDIPLPNIPSERQNVNITDPDEAIRILEKYTDYDKVVAFDYETTTLDPHEDGADILSVSIAESFDRGYFIPIAATDGIMGHRVFDVPTQYRIIDALRKFVASNTPKTVQNYYMEEMWSRKFLNTSIGNFVHDTMVSYHIVNHSNKGCTSLAFQAFENSGHEYKNDVDKNRLSETPIGEVCNYTCYDSRHTIDAFHHQTEILEREDGLREFNELFMRSLPTLANLKERGIRIDVDAMNNMEAEYKDRMISCTKKIRNNSKVKQLEGRQGKEFNPNSPSQWETLLYGIFKVKKSKKRLTSTGAGSTNKDTLKEIKNTTDDSEIKGILELLFEYRNCEDITKKVKEYRQLIYTDGKIHSTFKLNTADTFRSSATKPNCQNTYKHDKGKREFRRIIVAEPGQILLEADYKAHEARVIGMDSGDAELIRQTVEKIDIHKKWAGRIVGKPIDKVTADEKYGSKNQFVFPSIYGADPNAVAGYWGMKYPVEHFEKIQSEFWAEFPGVRAWQQEMVRFYNENGYIRGLSGFRCRGPLTIYQIYNWPIQGTAFHILLDALNRIDAHLVEHGFKTTVINEIHDSILFSAEPDEVDDVIEISTEIMKSQRFQWQTVPLDVSWEIGENWYEMQEL